MTEPNSICHADPAAEPVLASGEAPDGELIARALRQLVAQGEASADLEVVMAALDELLDPACPLAESLRRVMAPDLDPSDLRLLAISEPPFEASVRERIREIEGRWRADVLAPLARQVLVRH
jgi:hypothetical protein